MSEIGTHLGVGASDAGSGDDVGPDGDKMPLLPPPGDGRTNLGCVLTQDGVVMSDGVVRVVRVSWWHRCNPLAHSSCRPHQFHPSPSH